ncbi:MAG: hypothetical protein ACREIS_09050 [Nitrospiraceae bacterium]
MLGVVILATTLWVCPGDVYSNEPREGCKPFQETEGTFSTNPEPQPEADQRSSPSTSSSGSRQQQRAAPDSMNAEMCALYKEYIDLSIKTQGGAFMGGPAESQRWQTLKRMFQNSPAPNCS